MGTPVGLSISLRSDHPSAEAIRDLWREIERYEDAPSMQALGYPPHITLAVYDGDVLREGDVREAIWRAGRDLPAVVLTFDAIRSFDGPPMVVWAAPRSSPLLQRAHRKIHETLDSVHCRPHYRPGTWRPHCTLGTRVRDDESGSVLAFAAAFAREVEVTFDALDCVSFPPLKAMAMQKLPREIDGAPGRS